MTSTSGRSCQLHRTPGEEIGDFFGSFPTRTGGPPDLNLSMEDYHGQVGGTVGQGGPSRLGRHRLPHRPSGLQCSGRRQRAQVRARRSLRRLPRGQHAARGDYDEHEVDCPGASRSKSLLRRVRRLSRMGGCAAGPPVSEASRAMQDIINWLVIDVGAIHHLPYAPRRGPGSLRRPPAGDRSPRHHERGLSVLQGSVACGLCPHSGLHCLRTRTTLWRGAASQEALSENRS